METAAAAQAVQRRRDPEKTRQLLLDAAARRFAYDGYAATTVRDIADEAGVNVALINRYFQSKEGLFEACLAAAVAALGRAAGKVSEREQIAGAIARQAAGVTSDGRPNKELLLLLRSSGDERAEAMRVGLLRRFGERLAATAGWSAADHPSDDLLLRAQVVLATAVGITILRASGLQPVAAADDSALTEPLEAVVSALLGH